jgi:hypothetical protein
MRVLSLLIWLVGGVTLGRVLLAPFVGLTLDQSMLLLLGAASVIAFLFWLRWVFRQPHLPAGPTRS